MPLYQLIFALGYVRLAAATTVSGLLAFLVISLDYGAHIGIFAFVLALAFYKLINIGAKLFVLRRHTLEHADA